MLNFPTENSTQIQVVHRSNGVYIGKKKRINAKFVDTGKFKRRDKCFLNSAKYQKCSVYFVFRPMSTHTQKCDCKNSKSGAKSKITDNMPNITVYQQTATTTDTKMRVARIQKKTNEIARKRIREKKTFTK